MPLKSTADQWGSLTRWLHALIALALVGMACVGWYMKGLPNSPDKIKLYGLHKSTGLTVLALVLVRIAWRLYERAKPADPPGMPHWQSLAARWTHVGLYGVMLLMPLSGWLFNSAANFPLRWFGLFTVPALAGPDPDLKALAGTLHWAGFWLLAVLFTLHSGGALKHHFVDRDEVLRRMWWPIRGRAVADVGAASAAMVPTAPTANLPSETEQRE